MDTDGQNPKSALISYISNDSEGIVTTFDEHRHDFEDRMWIRFDQVEGMSEVNGVEFQIKVLSNYLTRNISVIILNLVSRPVLFLYWRHFSIQ